MIVTRNGHTFTVDDDDLSGDWGFWTRFADGRWEPEILDRMPVMVTGGIYVDVGAWIGPQLLWASEFATRCVGFEPDPTAAKILGNNVRDVSNVEAYQLAIGTYDGTTTIGTAGDSMSRVGQGDYEVPCATLATALEAVGVDDVDLFKIDIEGAEQDVFPHSGEFIRSFGCPVFLSIHPWITRDPLDGAKGWRVEQIAHHEVLLWPV